MIDFNKIVKGLGKKGGKIVFKEDIFEIIDPECKPEYSTLLNKTIYRLRAEGIIISLKAGVYIIPDEEDRELNSIDLIDKYYIKLLKKYITQNCSNQYYISGVKSLEYHMKDFSISQRIHIINRDINKKIKIGDYEIVFKTLAGKKDSKKINLFSKTFQYHKNLDINGTEFKISALEVAILEAAIVDDISLGLPVELLTKSIKKYGKILNYEIFRDIGVYKYNMSMNRLKELCRHINKDLYELFLDIIKKNGGCFVGEGLRNM